MTDKTKITLSAKELELVTNKEWILTKRVIIEKVGRLFAMLASSMQQYTLANASLLPTEVLAINPKISKGENYLELPYVMLDYPRYFIKADTLAIRTFFWWGNSFSIHLQLSGIYKEAVIPSLVNNFYALQKADYSICVGEDPWHHHFEADNYVSIRQLILEEFTAILNQEAFIKIAKQISLQQWDIAGELLENHFINLVRLPEFNFPADERGPSPGIPTTGFDL
jgi:hypothetical protein